MSITIPGAEALFAMESEQFGVSALTFLLDDIGCNGSESNLIITLSASTQYCGHVLSYYETKYLRKGILH